MGGVPTWSFVAIFLLTFYSKGVISRTSCSIHLNVLYRASEEPLFFSPRAEKIVYPNNKASIEVAGGEELIVYCGNQNFKNLKIQSDSIRVKCNSGSSFKILSFNGQTPTLDNEDASPEDSLTGGDDLENNPVLENLPEAERDGSFFGVESNSGSYSPVESDNLDLPSSQGSARASQGIPKFPIPALRRKPHGFHSIHGSDSVDAQSFACRNVVKSAIRPGKPCGITGREENHQEFSIGFPLSKGFLPLISVCFNVVSKSVLWSRHFVAPNVEFHMQKVPRIQFIQDSIPYQGNHLNVDRLYSRPQQTRTIAALLHSQALAEKYIEPKGNGFFARGHLAPKGDFVYAAEQLATFHFINVAPQWQYFNGGQWEKIESTLRDYIVQARIQATILTLTLGIIQLEDEERNDKDIFLFFNQENEDKLIKVPKLYAKIINFGNTTANSNNVVIVGVNQPHESHVKMSTNDVICQDVCHRYPWLSDIVRQNDHVHSPGYIYCCSPAEFIAYLKSGEGYMLDHRAHEESVGHKDDSSSEKFGSDEQTDSVSNEEGSKMNAFSATGHEHNDVKGLGTDVTTFIGQLSDFLGTSF